MYSSIFHFNACLVALVVESVLAAAAVVALVVVAAGIGSRSDTGTTGVVVFTGGGTTAGAD